MGAFIDGPCPSLLAWAREKAQRMKILRRDGMLKVKAGITTILEVERALFTLE